MFFTSAIDVPNKKEESCSFGGGGVRDFSGLLSHLDSSANLTWLSTFIASVKGSKERGRLEKRNTSCTGWTIDDFSGEGMSCPRSRPRMTGGSRGKVSARCFNNAPDFPGLAQEKSGSGLTAVKSKGPLGCFVSVTAM